MRWLKSSREAVLVQKFLKQHVRLVLLTILVNLAASVAESIGIGLFMPLLQEAAGGTSVESETNWFSRVLSSAFHWVPVQQRVPVIGAAIFGVIILRSTLVFATSACYGILDARVSHQMRSSVFARLMNVDYGRFEEIPSNQIFNTLAGETWRASAAITTLLEIVVSSIALLFYFCVLLLIDWKLTLLVAAAMLILSAGAQFIHRWSHALGHTATQANKQFTNRMLEGIEANGVIRTFSQPAFERRQFDSCSQDLSRQFLNIGLVAKLIEPLYAVSAAVLFIALLAWNPPSTAGIASMFVFLAILYRMQPRVRSLESKRVEFASLIAPLQEVAKLLSMEESVDTGRVPAGALTRHIRLDNVSYQHRTADLAALNGISCSLVAGQTTAIVGPSGCGKSTLVKLLVGLYRPTSGTIYIDDCAMDSIALASWREQVAVVSQDAYLFNASIAENIRYGRPDATDEEIVEAAEMADADSFVRNLPRQYQAVIGDRATRLSGGQRQRIALARAFIRRPSVLILDEATSAVDKISEDLINQSVSQYFAGCTVIIIAHRLSSIAQADRVIVLDHGVVRQQGEFTHLMQREGLFNQLYGAS